MAQMWLKALPKAANSPVRLYCLHDHVNLLTDVFLTSEKTQSDVMSLISFDKTIRKHKVLLRNTITLIL